MAKRARIMLLAADGRSNRDIGVLVDMHYNQVGMWRKRYEALGLAGLGDLERPGRPCIYDHDDVLLLVMFVTEPPSGSRWTMEGLARRWPSTACRSLPPSAGASARRST
jgi:putative transposase